MAETGKATIKPAEQPVKKGVSFAEHFTSNHPEIKPARESRQGEGPDELSYRAEKTKHLSAEEVFYLAKESYDLFLERQDLRVALQRSKREGVETGKGEKPLSIEEKKRLISEGKAGEILSIITREDSGSNLISENKQRIQQIEDRLKEILSHKEVYERYQEGFGHEMSIIEQIKEVTSLEELSEALKFEELRVTRKAWTEKRRLITTETTFIQNNIQLQTEIERRIDEIITDPEVFAAARVRELQKYQKQLKSDRFAETPSRKELVDRVGTLIAEGKKILLTGETGTGKTELWFHTARKLFGTKGQYVTGRPDLTLYEIYGRTGIGRQKDGERGDVFREGKLTKSFHSREGRGEPFLWDELDNTRNQVIMGIKTHLNARPGTIISIQMNGERDYTIGPDWAFGATANIKSVRYQTRVKLDPAIVRVFDGSIRVSYMPPDELYDVLLASMLDKRGGLSLAAEDAQDTLVHYVGAIDWIQNAFQGKKIFTNKEQTEFLPSRGGAAVGKSATLKDAVLDPGKALSMLAGYEQAKAKMMGLREYLNEQIFRFIDNENYPEDDRYYLIEIFALHGFFGGWDAEKFGLAGLNTSTLRRWNAGIETEAEINPNAYIPPEQVALLDPYGKLKKPIQEGIDDLLGEKRVSKDDLGQFQTTIELGQIQAALAAEIKTVGDIGSNDQTKNVHYRYLSKLRELGEQTESLDMRKKIIKLLEKYVKDGYFRKKSNNRREIDSKYSLKIQAKQKAEELRQLAINNAQDLSVIEELAGDLTAEGSSKQTHVCYLNRVHEIGLNTASLQVLEEAEKQLEQYIRGGYFEINSYGSGSAEVDLTLLDLAKQKRKEISSEVMEYMRSHGLIL